MNEKSDNNHAVNAEPRRNILRASLVSATGTGISRIAGAARDIAIAHVFGAGRASDAFWIAWTVPSLFRRFVADEGLMGALIPAVAQTEREEGTAEAKRLARATLTVLLLAGGIICAGGILAAPYLIKIIAWGFDPEKNQLTVQLTRWLFPFVVFVSLVSYAESLLNHRNHFFVPKLAPGLVSGCIAGAALLLSSHLAQPVMALVFGVLAGGLVHFLLCIPPLVARWGWPWPGILGFTSRRFGFFMGEMLKVAGIGLLAQINVVALRLLASLLAPGSVTQYWYANRVVDLAQGTIAVAVGSALLPAIASDAANRAWSDFRRHFSEALLLVAVVLLPAAGLLIAMAEPVVSILFRHGEFDTAAAANSARTLQMLVPFMLTLAAINIVKKAYFALDDRTTLLGVGAVGLVATAGLGYFLSHRYGVQGLGLALSISGTLQLIAYLVLLRHKMGERLGLSTLALPLLKSGAAALPAAGCAYVITQAGEWDLGPTSPLNWILLIGAGLTAGVVYLALGWLLGIEPLRALIRRARQR